MYDFAKVTLMNVSLTRSMLSDQTDGSLAAPSSCCAEVEAQLTLHVQEHSGGC